MVIWSKTTYVSEMQRCFYAKLTSG